MSRKWYVAAVLCLGLALVIGLVATRSQPSAVCSQLIRNAAASAHRADDGSIPAAVLGDSWASGWGEPDSRVSFASELARLEHWDAIIDAFPGRGYVVEVCGDHRLLRAVPSVPAQARVVVLEGGLNDVVSPLDLESLRAAAVATIRAVLSRVPSARVVVVGIPSVPARSDRLVAEGNQNLQAAATAAGAQFLGLSGLRIPLQADGLHPTAAGQLMVANFLAGAIGSGN